MNLHAVSSSFLGLATWPHSGVRTLGVVGTEWCDLWRDGRKHRCGLWGRCGGLCRGRLGVPSRFRGTGTSRRDVPTVLDVAVRRRCLGLAEAEPERFEVTGFFAGDGEIWGLGCEVGLEDGTVSGVEGGKGALGETFWQKACGVCGEE